MIMLLFPSQTAVDSVASINLDTDMLSSVAAAVLLGMTVALLVGFAASARVESPRIESHWGGFGGTGGGWRMSTSMAYLIGALAFAAMFTALVKPMSRPATASVENRKPAKAALAQAPKPDNPDSVRASPAPVK
jgi:hypothetical protein